MAYARSYWNAKSASEHLEAALAHRAEIEQAKGIIIGATGASPDAAFEVLVQQSQHENRKLREVALDLVNSKIHRPKAE
jgi:AmiR/NasT family two-component response regulator